MGWLLPYATAGIAIGRADYTTTASVGYPQPTETLPPPPPPPITVPPTPPTPPTLPRPIPPGFGPVTQTETKSGVLSIGYALGGGVDIGLMPGVFIRGEYEFVQLGNFGGITANINNFRVAAAVKF